MSLKGKTPPVSDYDDSGRIVALNDDVSTEILLLLPAKNVTRFKLVSKRWLSLISGDQFCRLYTLRRPKSQSSLLIRASNSRFFYFNPTINGEMLPYNFTLPNPKILSSCNGLMLLQCDNPQSDYYVYNPTTKQSRKITLTNSEKYTDVIGLHLAFDPFKSPHYKIVCVRAEGLPEEETPSALLRSYQIEVYHSESRSWKVCLEPFIGPTTMNFSCGVHCNNFIYGKTLYGSVYYFDIDNDVIRFLPRPRTPGGSAICYSQLLQESNGYLHSFAVVSDHKGESVALWELQEDDHSHSHFRWLLKYHDRVGQLRGRSGTSLLRFIRGSDGEEESTLVICVDGKIGAYSFVDKSYEDVVYLTSHPSFYDEKLHSGDVHQFGESLALV